jgi:hypothetical protein
MEGDAGDIEERILKLSGSDVRHGTRHPVNISPKNGAISVGSARTDAHAKADARVPITPPFGKASTQAMSSILTSPATAIPHRRTIAFDYGTDPDFGEFPENRAHTQSEPRSRSRAIRNAAGRPRSRTLAEGTALKSLSAQANS